MKLDIVKHKFIYLAISAILLIPGIIAMVYSMITYDTHTPVKVGVRMGNRYEIISGIDDGATIVTSGQTRLRNNIKVDIVK